MDFIERSLWGNPVSSYLAFLAFVFGSFAVARIARYVVHRYVAKWAEKTESKWDDVIIESIMGPSTWLVAIGGAFVAKEGLVLTEKADLWANRILSVAAITVLYVGMFRLFRGGSGLLVEEFVRRAGEAATEEERALETRSVNRITKQLNEVAGMVIVLLAVLTALSNLGVDLKAVWASLGVGGIALALAVKEPLSNFVGRIMIYSTGLFDEGHFIQIDSWAGTVTRIGTFRTSIELLSDMSIVTIPNAEFISKPVKNNFGKTKFIYKWDLDVPYEVDADRLDALVEELRALIKGKPEVVPEFSFVYLDRLDKYSKVVRVWFQVRLPDFKSSTVFGERTLGEVQRLFSRMGVAFAYPTYTVALDGHQEAGRPGTGG